MESIERLETSREPPVRDMRMAFAERKTEDNDNKREPVDVRAVRLVETEGNIFQARLSYDAFEADVFVEILDPTTGDVVRRLPAERVAEENTAFRGGTFLDRLA